MIYPLKEMTQLWDLRKEFIELLCDWMSMKSIHGLDELRQRTCELFAKDLAIESISPNKPKEIDK